jgi:hypothetical protein
MVPFAVAKGEVPRNSKGEDKEPKPEKIMWRHGS